MSAWPPSAEARGACPWLSIEVSGQARLQGWAVAGIVAASLSTGLVSGLALLAEPAPQPFAVALAPSPTAAAPPLTALPEPAPQVTSDPAPGLKEPAPPAPQPQLASADPAPKLPQMPAAPMPSVNPDSLPVIDAATPTSPQSQKAKLMARPKPKTEPMAKAKPKKDPAAKPAQPASKPTLAAPATAAKASGAVSPQAWANAVVKQIRKTARRTATGRGTVQIGFTVGADGRLTAVKVLKSSGVATVDAMGLDHIRRAAPFPAPPSKASRNLAFAFEMR